MKKPVRAALMSMVIPGSGLWYTGHRKMAVANFLIALICPLAGLMTGFLAEHIHYVILAIAAGSAGLAHAMAERSNP